MADHGMGGLLQRRDPLPCLGSSTSQIPISATMEKPCLTNEPLAGGPGICYDANPGLLQAERTRGVRQAVRPKSRSQAVLVLVDI